MPEYEKSLFSKVRIYQNHCWDTLTGRDREVRNADCADVLDKLMLILGTGDSRPFNKVDEKIIDASLKYSLNL